MHNETNKDIVKNIVTGKKAEVSIEYKIKGIQPYPPKKGHVSILLTPVTPLPDPNVYHRKPTMKIQQFGPTGRIPIPDDLIQNIGLMIEESLPPEMRKRERDPREIVLIEDENDFYARKWEYGDIISVNFSKIKNARDVLPQE